MLNAKAGNFGKISRKIRSFGGPSKKQGFQNRRRRYSDAVNIPVPLQHIDANLWLMDYPLRTLGVNLHRVVTIIRLASGKLVIHSTAPFLPTEVESIRELGQPEWLVDALLRHATFAAEGHKAFPGISYLAPEGFSRDLPFPTGSLLSPPAEWEGEIQVAAIDGVPAFGEIVMCHQPSRTLIVGDLIVNFAGVQGWWEKLLSKAASVGGKYEPGMTKPFKSAIRDSGAFAASVQRVLEWDFDRIIVGHGRPIPTGGKQKLRGVMQAAGVL